MNYYFIYTQKNIYITKLSKKKDMETLLNISNEIAQLVFIWKEKLQKLDTQTVSYRANIQNRTIKQIVGHMIDSATNNTHRVIHLQYDRTPNRYPDYANLGNNDRWIAIQNYQNEEWNLIVQTWKYCNLHFAHVIKQVNHDHFYKEWISALDEVVTLINMIEDYPRHLKLHLNEIEDLLLE